MAILHASLSKGLSKLNNWAPISHGISGKAANGNFRVLLYNDNIARITASKHETFEDFSYAVIAKPEVVELNTTEDDTHVHINLKHFNLSIDKAQSRFTFTNKQNVIINEDDAFGISWNGEQVTTYKKLQTGERFIGLGEKTGPLDRRGQGYQNWNTDNFAYHSGADPLYCSTPFYIGIHNGLVYGIFLDNTFKSFVNFGASNNRFSSFSADRGDMNYYFIYGESVAEIIKHYTHLTGRMPLPPLWSIGYQQCRYSYFPDTEVQSIADTFHEKDIPADVIVFDIHYMEAYKIFTWHKEHFRDPKKLIADLQAKGFEVVVMCDPGIKVEDGYHTYENGLKENVFIKYPDGSNFTAQVWPGWCHFPDFTKPATRNWWKEQFKEYVSLGVKGFWNDMNEIATWGNQLPENIELDFEGNPDSMRRGRNIYGMQMARSTYEGTRALMKGQRPFNLTRSGFSGIQRYAAVWTGDNVATDEHMMLGTRMLNSMGLAGIAFCGYDVGGFVGDANPKLFARWIALGAFSPFFRGHSMVNSRDSEPWSFGEEVEEISRNYIKLRYRLMPYIYSAFFEATQTGMPINRSLALYYPHDDKVYQGNYQHQYLFGANLLVAPIESYKDLMKVYLPECSWYSLYDDTHYQAGETIVECPADKLPVFIKASSVLVMHEQPGSNTKQKQTTLEIHVYKGENLNSFTRYEDDGESFDYETGHYCTQELIHDALKKTLTIEKVKGQRKSQYSQYKIYFHGFTNLKKVSVNGVDQPAQYKHYRFLQPLRSFDPVGTVNEGYKINDLPYIEISASDEAIKIQL
jgi:alpha-glucosidase